MNSKFPHWLPTLATIAAIAALALFFTRRPEADLSERLPGADRATGMDAAGSENPAAAGKLTKGEGAPEALPGAWPWFRGQNLDATAPEEASTPLARSWGTGGPRVLWTTPVGEGYGGAAVQNGRVYLIDFDRDQHESAFRCLSLADGHELWRYAYPLALKRNHGMTRTVPSVSGTLAVAMDPKCNVVCVDAATGELRWAVNLVHDYGCTVPPWYAGQCPIVSGSTILLAPAGPEVLMIAVDAATGKPLWKAPNPRGWKMTHSSITPMEFEGRRMFVYCASGGVVGVAADTGEILWDTTDWKISIATVPSPLVIEGGRIFLAGGYNAGSLMLGLRKEGGKFVARTLFRLRPEVFGATQQTPVYHAGHFYGTRPDGQFACIDTDGKQAWASGPGTQFGLGPWMMAGNLFLVLNDNAKLTLIDGSPSKYTVLAQVPVFKDGHEAWAPMALAGTRLLVRDFTRLTCLDLAGSPPPRLP